MSEKKSFKVYKEWSAQFQGLCDADAGELIKAIFTYQSTGEAPSEMSPIVAMAFSFIKQQFDRDDESYEETSRARSEAGKKGGAPKGNSNASKQSNRDGVEADEDKQNQTKQAKTSKNKQNKLKEEVEDEEEVEEVDLQASKEASAMQTSSPFPTLPLNDGTQYVIQACDVDKWRLLYPAVDIEQQLRNMAGWLDANPKNRKTKAGVCRFINSWLSREQNKAPPDRRKDKRPMISERARKAGFDIDLEELFEKP